MLIGHSIFYDFFKLWLSNDLVDLGYHQTDFRFEGINGFSGRLPLNYLMSFAEDNTKAIINASQELICNHHPNTAKLLYGCWRSKIAKYQTIMENSTLGRGLWTKATLMSRIE